jgi:hypothetical protein
MNAAEDQLGLVERLRGYADGPSVAPDDVLNEAADEIVRLRNLLVAVLPLCEEACADSHIPSDSGALLHLQSLRDRVRDAIRA